MKNRAKRWIGTLLAACLVMALLPAAAFAADTGKAIQLVSDGSAANIGGGQADNVYFGNYYQSNGSTKDPVKWRVLSSGNQQLFLLSDQNLEVCQYHTERDYVTWDTSTIRSWLNGYGASSNTGGSSGIDYAGDNFLDAAFSDKEQVAIATTTVVNDDNKDDNYSTDGEGGNNTTDRIFLLSIDEALDLRYFPKGSNNRYATNTLYVAEGGRLETYMNGEDDGYLDNWWLRSPGVRPVDACGVRADGRISGYGSRDVNRPSGSLRPVIWVTMGE